MKLEQAARQALVALEDVMADFDGSWALADTAITALREALAEQAEQESVVKIHKYNEFQTLGSLNLSIGTKLYAAPVRTKDLTDDEIDALVDSACDSQMPMDMFARAVIQEYRTKNGIV